MRAEEKHLFAQRIRCALSSRVPASVLDGDARMAADYKDCAQHCAAYLAGRLTADRAKPYLVRLEAVQAVPQ